MIEISIPGRGKLQCRYLVLDYNGTLAVDGRLMLKEAALGVAVIQGEGAAAETLLAADVVCRDIVSALELLSNSLRLVATLRS